MTPRLASIVAAIISLAIATFVQAQPSAHYVPGIEGIKGASLPPPGLYLRDYSVAYRATRVNNNEGKEMMVPGFEAFTFANVPRLVYITGAEFLGGYVGVDALLPIVYQSVKAGPFRDSTWGIGDFFAEATLSWHTKQFDYSAGLGAWAPTGASDRPPTTRVGAGFWTPMLTGGATWHIDTNKTWALSALTRYEINSEHRHTDITPGQAFTLEYGLSKTLGRTIDVGAAGYYQAQVTRDSGRGASNARDMVAGIGPEISIAVPEQMFFLSLRYVYEFTSEDRAQGGTVALTLTKKL